jgi:VanZ family protein
LLPEGGLLFGKHGSLMSAGIFRPIESQGGGSCSIEIWLDPGRVNSSGTILAFYSAASRYIPFAMQQSLGDLELQRAGQDRFNKKAKIYVNDVFSRLQPVFITISSSEAGTSVYVDGVLSKRVTGFRISSHDFAGQLVIANAPDTSNSWSGQLKVLAIYDRELSAPEVAEHFTDWRKDNPSHLGRSDGVVASYFFDEGKGSVVHNRVDSATNLLIPDHYFVLREQFLERPWDEFRPDRNYLKDVGINIIGFVPLGFFFRALLSVRGKDKRASWLTVVLGFAVSLTIEVVQAFLPTRDSGMTDLFTNTLGTGLGVMLCVWSVRLHWFSRPAVSSRL